MMLASTVSRRSNRCACVYATDYGWARAFPMASRYEAHKILSLLFARDDVPPICICDNAKEMIQGKLSLLFARDGVLPVCICDNAKEMIQGKFYQKLKNAACHLKHLDTYTLWSNASEREIKELEKGISPKMLQSKASRNLWDDCLEYAASIRSNTTHDIFKLDGEVSKTVTPGET